MNYPITTETEKLFNEGGNFTERRKQFYTTGRCKKCGKGDVDCNCPKIGVVFRQGVSKLSSGDRENGNSNKKAKP